MICSICKKLIISCDGETFWFSFDTGLAYCSGCHQEDDQEMKLSERILAAWAEKEWPGQQMQGWANEVAQLEADLIACTKAGELLHGALSGTQDKCEQLEAENEALRDGIQSIKDLASGNTGEPMKTRCLAAIFKQADALLTGEESE